jgi:putative Mn2+ efflux pump MntP
VAEVHVLSVLAIALGLSADCFAVAVSGSISRDGHSRLDILRVSLSFGIFQALMPVLGWLAGRTVVGYIADYDHWIAFFLLALVGGKMLWESFYPVEDASRKTDITRGLPLLVLSVATSIDALAVGLSFAFLDVNIAAASLTIGVVAFLATGMGFIVGKKSTRILGKRAELIGAIILIAIGLRILLSHLYP